MRRRAGTGFRCLSGGCELPSSGDWDSGNPAFAISRGSPRALPQTPGLSLWFPDMLLSPFSFESRSANRPKNLPSSSSQLSRGCNRAPRGAQEALNFALCRRASGFGVDEADAKHRTRPGELGAHIGRPAIDQDRVGHSPRGESGPQGGLQADGVLGMGPAVTDECSAVVVDLWSRRDYAAFAALVATRVNVGGLLGRPGSESGRIIAGSETFKEREQRVGRPIAPRLRSSRRNARKCALFDGEIALKIGLSRTYVGMT